METHSAGALHFPPQVLGNAVALLGRVMESFTRVPRGADYRPGRLPQLSNDPRRPQMSSAFLHDPERPGRHPVEMLRSPVEQGTATTKVLVIRPGDRSNKGSPKPSLTQT